MDRKMVQTLDAVGQIEHLLQLAAGSRKDRTQASRIVRRAGPPNERFIIRPFRHTETHRLRHNRKASRPAGSQDIGAERGTTERFSKPAISTSTCLSSCRSADLVVADITTKNPNTYYDSAPVDFATASRRTRGPGSSGPGSPRASSQRELGRTHDAKYSFTGSTSSRNPTELRKDDANEEDHVH